jgi:dienelactone hydrolase
VPLGSPVDQLVWRRRPFTAAGITHDLFEKGEGPGVVVLPEIPGIHPEVLGFADHLVDQGFSVVLVSLYGVPGKEISKGYGLSTVAKVCVSAEFRAFAMNAHRPVTDYLRAVSRELAARTPGKGVGVVGSASRNTGWGCASTSPRCSAGPGAPRWTRRCSIAPC